MEEKTEITVQQPEVKEEKTYTQAEVDNIVKSRLARERNKVKTEEVKKPTAEEIDEIINSDRKWFEENVGGSFEEFLRNEEFEDFMNENPLSIRKGMEKFVKLKGADNLKKSNKLLMQTLLLKENAFQLKKLLNTLLAKVKRIKFNF